MLTKKARQKRGNRRKSPPFVAMKSFEFTSSYSMIDCAKILEKEFKSSGLFPAYRSQVIPDQTGICTFRIIEGASIEIEGQLKPSKVSATIGTVSFIWGNAKRFFIAVTIIYYIYMIIVLITAPFVELKALLCFGVFPIWIWLTHARKVSVSEVCFIRLPEETVS